MIRLILVLILLFPSVLSAATVPLRSGEHDGFSRIVLQLSSPAAWQFGSVPGGYELRIASPDLVIDPSAVFRFISHARIGAVRIPGPGRLRLNLACACQVEAFEMDGGRIVLDVRDPAGGKAGAAPSPLPPLADGAPWSPHPAEAAAGAPAPFLFSSAMPARFVTVRPSNFARGLPADPPATLRFPSLPAKTVPPDEPVPAGRPGLSSRANLPIVPGKPTVAPADEPRAGQMAQIERAPSVEPNRNADTRSEIAGSPAPPSDAAPEGTPAPKRFDPSSLLPLLGDPKDRARGQALQGELLKQLSRAAAQGVIKVPVLPTAIQHENPPEQTGNHATATSDTPADATTTMAAENLAAESARGPADPADHMRIQSVVDRDSSATVTRRVLSDNGEVCLDTDAVDIASWGPETDRGDPFGDLRTRLVGEFDRPDDRAVETLARRYLFLGFGAEARALLAAFDPKIRNRDILLQLADIVDGDPVPPGGMTDQLSCHSPVAMWSILALPEIPAGATVDTRSILRGFSVLPAHLRDLLGPRLAKRFLARGDLDTATAIRDIIDRGAGAHGAAFRMLNAQLAAQDNRGHAGEEQMLQVAANDGAREPEAVIEYIESRLSRGEPVSKSIALLADALAVEHRDTELGRRLMRVAIMGLADSGEIEATFDRIATAMERGDLDRKEAEELRARAHIKNAERPSDAQFLKTLFAYPLPGGTSPLSRQARTAAAARLVDLGLADKALALLPAEDDPGEADRIVMARILLARGNADEALARLDGLESRDARLVRARALEAKHDYSGAAQEYAQLEMADRSDSAALRARDWKRLENAQSPELRDLARAMQDLAKPDGGANAATNPGETASIVSPGPVTLAQGRGILSRSEADAALFDRLLKAD